MAYYPGAALEVVLSTAPPALPCPARGLFVFLIPATKKK